MRFCWTDGATSFLHSHACWDLGVFSPVVTAVMTSLQTKIPFPAPQVFSRSVTFELWLFLVICYCLASERFLSWNLKLVNKCCPLWAVGPLPVMCNRNVVVMSEEQQREREDVLFLFNLLTFIMFLCCGLKCIKTWLNVSTRLLFCFFKKSIIFYTVLYTMMSQIHKRNE